MKSKISLMMFVAIVLMLYSCDDVLDFDFDATFNTNMSIDVAETKSDGFDFSATENLNIKDDDEVEKYINKIKNLEITRVDCTLTGIPQGATIHELTVKVEELNLQVTLNNLIENQTLSLPVDAALLTALSGHLKTNHEATITVSGTSSDAPMTFGVKLTYISKVTASL
jgi:hypothetical protein